MVVFGSIRAVVWLGLVGSPWSTTVARTNPIVREVVFDTDLVQLVNQIWDSISSPWRWFEFVHFGGSLGAPTFSECWSFRVCRGRLDHLHKTFVSPTGRVRCTTNPWSCSSWWITLPPNWVHGRLSRTVVVPEPCRIDSMPGSPYPPWIESPLHNYQACLSTRYIFWAPWSI